MASIPPHQIITGALNSGESAFAVGSVEGISFTACAVGCDIVILASDFQRVQIIPGSATGYVQALCLDCCYETGKIAAAFYDLIRIYEPMALSSHTSQHKLDYQWFETCCFNVGSAVTNLSWNLEGLRLLVSTEKELQMFQHRALTEYYFCSGEEETNGEIATSEKTPIKFDLGEQSHLLNHNNNERPSPLLPNSIWECVWKNQLSSPLRYIKFSPDGTLFATAGSNDGLVKVWYQDSGGGLDSAGVTFSFIYLPHPRPVVGFEWRKTGRYMPRGCVANVLVTWCRDHICRIWCETSVPTEVASDMLLDLKSEKFPPRSGAGSSFGVGVDEKDRHKHHRLKNARVKIAHRLKHLKKIKKTTANVGKQKGGQDKTSPSSNRVSVPSLSLVPSVSVLPESFDLPPVLHFHLAASISADTDCFLVPSLDGCVMNEATFAVHWLNNKELWFSLGAEKLLAEALAIEHPGVSGLWNNNAASPMLERGTMSTSGTDKASDDGSSTQSVAGDVPTYASSKITASSTAESVSALGSKDILDLKLEQLLREWQHSADILFTIHPLDGSLLVWTMDYLDDCGRQPQVSFSSRLPAAFPMSDAASLNHNLAIFNPHDPIYVELLRRVPDMYAISSSSTLRLMPALDMPAQMCNTVFLLTTHRNGTLNLWHLNIDEKSKFCIILSIAHKSRMCGHRFRVSGVSCHPVLPLFLTVSHHNIRRRKLHRKMADAGGTDSKTEQQTCQEIQVFNSELILWKVNPVGPLCKSGGVRELARINSPDVSAFSSVAWIPAILPSSTLGSVSNSPSSCFVASDGRCLRVYQAVIDARALLTEINYAKAQKARKGAMSSSSSCEGGFTSAEAKNICDSCHIVSSQSTARPGCIIELDAITDAFHDWRHIQLLHVFNEPMIRSDQMALSSPYAASNGNVPSTPTGTLRQNFFTPEEASVVIDRTKSTIFHDRFYLVVLEKNKTEVGGAVIHMWLLGLASQVAQPLKGGSRGRSASACSPADDTSEYYPTADDKAPLSTAKLFIYSKKVCSQLLPLPPGVKVVSACPAAGHLASSSLYPACRAPFLLTTACSDDHIRFWYVKVETDELGGETKYKWAEWRMVSESRDSHLEMDGKIFAVSSGYSGRFACSYDPSNSCDTEHAEVINVEVSVFECESTGGIEWQQEDVIHLRNIVIPKGVRHHAEEFASHATTPMEELLTDFHVDKKYAGTLLPRVPSMPKMGTTELRRVVSEHSLKKQPSDYTTPQVVRLDWVSTEDGSHVLTVGVGSKIILFAPVSADVAQQNVAIMREMDPANPLHARRQTLVRKASTICVPVVKKLIRWVALRSIALDSADGLPPVPLMLSWVREGILVVGMESEMRIYHQWNISPVSQNELSQHSIGGGSHRLGTIPSSTFVLGKDEASESTDQAGPMVKFDFDLKKVSGVLATPSISISTMVTPTSAASIRHLRISPSHSMLDLAKRGKESGGGSATGSTACARRGRDRKRGGDDASRKEDTSSAGNDVISIIRDEGLFEAARLATPLIPQYHPRQLMELLNAGKTRRVKSILLHVLRCIRENNVVYNDALARQASLHSDECDGPSGRSHSITRLKSDASLDDSPKTFVEIGSIPPLPLHALMAADSMGSNAPGSEKDSGLSVGGDGTKGATYDDLFSGVPTNDDNLDIDWEDEDEQDEEEADEGSVERTKSARRRKQSISSADIATTTAFSAKHTRMLSKLLSHVQLPGLSSVDQMHLLAVADTLSSFSADAIDRLAQANAALRTPLGGVESSEGVGYAVTCGGIDSVDECGLRFLMAMKQHEYLLRCLPLKQRAHLMAAGLSTAHIIWALHSETESELLNSLSCMQRGSPRWSELRALGVGWWLKSTATLRQLIEKVAKTAFQARSDPMDAAIYYLSMKKKNLLTHLYKSARDTKMTDFFSQDFTTEKWKKAALKNAFVLMGKQRFEHAVAFFLLGDSLNDALQVCVSNLNDLQLALVIVRLYESDGDRQHELVRRLLRRHVIGSGDECKSSAGSFDNNGSTVEPHYEPVSDPFLRSMAYWLLKEYHQSAMVFLEDLDVYTTLEDDGTVESMSRYSISDIFNFYAYLRTHPMVIRQRLNLANVNIGSTERFLEVAKTMGSQITPVERKLYFKTASTHFKSGCALLALEVLCKLPKNICLVPPAFGGESSGVGGGEFPSAQSKIPQIIVKKEESSEPQQADAVDWGASSLENGISVSKRFGDEPLELKWDEDEKGSDEEGEQGLTMNIKEDKTAKGREDSKQKWMDETNPAVGGRYKLDIMAQQLKFIACLKILMEELATLASGYEMDGGQLRVQLYFWLEKEVEVLKQWCDYNVGGIELDDILEDENVTSLLSNADSEPLHQPVLLHVALRNDRASLTAKFAQAYRRRRWLANNQQLLRTLISYCSLHSSQGVGLAAARMELLLLLQELHQEQPVQKTLLASPIPLQSSFPLLAASVASIKTDIAGPLRYLHCQASDLLKSFAEMRTPELMEDSLSKVYMFYNLSQSLSACIYDSLWEIENLASGKGYAMPGGVAGGGVLLKRRRHISSTGDSELTVTSAPNKWPGVENLLALLSRERDEDVPNLLVLLAESWCAVYLALFAYALTSYDSRWLYRLAAHPVNANVFSTVFGGGGEKRVTMIPDSAGGERPARPVRPPPPKVAPRDASPNALSIDLSGTATDPSKLRAKFHAKVFGQPSGDGRSPATVVSPAVGQSQHHVATLKQWVPPKKSIVAYFVSRPPISVTEESSGLDYDSEASFEDIEEDEDLSDADSTSIGTTKTREKIIEPKYHADPNSFAWAILRLALVRQANVRLHQFLTVCGFEYNELGTVSPLIHRCVKTLEGWRHYAESILDSYPGGCPPVFLPDMSLDNAASSTGPSVRKYRVILESDNTPFSSNDSSAMPVKRLWMFLVRQEYLTDIFIRYIFRLKKAEPGGFDTVSDTTLMTNATGNAPPTGLWEPLKIVHREQDPITGFALSQAHFGWFSLSTGREIQEMDLSNVFSSHTDWMQDTTELDLAMFEMKKDPLRDNDDYVLITPEKRESAVASSRGSSFLCKRQVPGVRRMEAHPLLPYYIAGANDGSVRLWEWGVGQPFLTPRVTGQFPKVTKTRFNAQGNKFGITDGEGNLCLWQLTHGSAIKKPYLNFGCHTKSAADFVFIGNSSSLLATAGYSSGDVNIALWDSLLPTHKALVQSWSCHPEGATCLAYAPLLQALLSAGRHGEVCIWDVRQRQLRQTLKVFDHTPVRCLVLDPAQEFFAVGSADGDIKVWSLTVVPQLLYNFPGEHATKGGFASSLRQVGGSQLQGVQHMWVDTQQRLYSCGADCSLKIRVLPSQTQEPHVL